MSKTTHEHILQDVATQLRRAAKMVDVLADGIIHNVAPDSSRAYAIAMIEKRVHAAMETITLFKPEST